MLIPDPASIPFARARARPRSSASWRAGWYCKYRRMRNQTHGAPVSNVIACSGGDGDWSVDCDQNASAHSHVRQVEVVLPGGAVVGNLPTADDRPAIVAERPRVALREVQGREVRGLSP